MGTDLIPAPKSPDMGMLEATMGTEARRVFNWRVEQLVNAGVSFKLAEEVCAEDPRFDYRPVLALIERGCPPDLAVGIAQ